MPKIPIVADFDRPKTPISAGGDDTHLRSMLLKNFLVDYSNVFLKNWSQSYNHT
jgi:hypothetical protein